MKNRWIYIFIFSVVLFSVDAIRSEKVKAPVKFLSSCEMDLNNDKQTDIAMLMKTRRGMELIILIIRKDKYVTYNYFLGESETKLECHYGKAIKETDAGHGDKKGKTYKTNGAYLIIAQPEGAARALFWDNNKFHEVWTAD